MRLLALQTKSMGWIKALHNFEKGKFIDFTITRDKKIMASIIIVNPLCEGGFSASLDFYYPMDDVLDYVVSN